MEEENPPSYQEVIFEDNKPQEEPRCITMRPRKYVVEPLIFLYLVSGFPLITVIGQWTYVKIGEEMGIDVNTNHNISIDTNCSKGHCPKDLVQAASVDFKMKLHLASFIPQLLSPLIIGAISDRYGRRIMLILPCISSLIMVITYLTVMWFKLSVWWVYMNVLGSFFGSFPVMMVGCFAYIADTVPPAERGFRMTVVDVTGMLSGSVVSLLVGYVVTKTDFWVPLFGVLFGKIIVLLYVLFCVPESLSNKPSERKVTIKHLFSGFKLFFVDNGKGRIWRLWLLLMMFCVTDIIGSWGISTEYFMNAPRKWNSLKISMYSAISAVVESVVVLAFSKISYNLVPMKYRVIIGRLSSAGRDVCMAFAKSTAIILIAPVFGCLSFLASPIIRTLMTYHVAKDEQGSMLSIITTAGSIFGLVSTVASAKLYKATEPTWDGCIYFVTGMLQILSALFMVLYIILTRHDPDPNLVKEDQESIVGNIQWQSEEDGDDVKELAD